MADNSNPTGNNTTLSSEFLPKYFRTDANTKFLHATVDQLIQPGTVKQVNGYIGRQNAKATTGADIFVDAVDDTRQNYQLEPGLVVNDSLGNNTFFRDYQDYINQIKVFGGNVQQHARLNSEEFYSWNPHINWDKFVNFQNYYWLPNGPSIIPIFGTQQKITSTYDVSIQNELGDNVYIFSPTGVLGLTPNPTIKLYKGQTYIFDIKSLGNPFSIKTSRTSGVLDRYTNLGVSGYAVENGTITFTVPNDAPKTLYYVSESDPNVGGVFEIYTINENTFINVEKEIIGKKTYILENGTSLSNGMKVTFIGTVEPSIYATGNYYIEGVGLGICLIKESSLEIIGPYTTTESVLFDDTPFDSLPFSNAASYPGVSDYIVVNRSSNDRNPWSRNNRWFHIDVIKASAIANGTIAVLDHTARAVRPIIEFEAGLKLFNFGINAVDDVDLIDTVTTDVFSIIEGSNGYNIDGVDLVSGHTIIFAADNDIRVKNKTFQVEIVDVIQTSESVSTDATETVATGNTVIVGSTANLEVGRLIVFSGAAIGDIIPGKNYYISSILNDTTITISNTFKGPVALQKNAKGTMLVASFHEITTKKIRLVEFQEPQSLQTVLVRRGVKNQGVSYWYDGANWMQSQIKTIVNQSPLFDIVDDDKISYSNVSTYPGSTFIGTKVFSYNIGAGTSDTILGFPLSYGNINNIGDILFNFNLATDYFEYKSTTDIIRKDVNIGYLVKSTDNGVLTYVNGWQTVDSALTQAAVRIYKNSKVVNNFPLDIFDNINNLPDLKIVVYVNGIRLDISNWAISDGTKYKVITLVKDISLSDVLTVKAFAKQQINNNGFYEIPYNLQNNPFNTLINSFSLGEVIDHLNSIVDNLTTFIGTNPGTNNLRDLGNIAQYGTKFLQHSSPLSLSIYHITSEQNNVIRAIDYAKVEYTKFKRNFITTSEQIGIDADPVIMVDLILQKMFKDKPKTAPYYFSDMVAFGPSTKNDLTVIDYRIKSYPLHHSWASSFSLDKLSSHAVLVYLNGTQLLTEHEYTFDNQGFVIISANMNNGDIITIYEFENTNGCFVPPTPSKLGLWPTVDPRVYLDTSLVNHTWTIQGHDGSHTVLYGEIVNGVFTDYRDAILLELERRIYNNIKVKYNSDIFDIYDIIPGYNRATEYNLTEFNEILSPNFYKWVKHVGIDYSQNQGFDRNTNLTFNYSYFDLPNGTSCPGYWRGIYNWVLDTDSPDRTPWEMLGFNDKPTWWDEVYGPAPYTSNNLIMWQDLTDGRVRQPGVPAVILSKFSRPDLINHIPVDEIGNLLDPLTAGWAAGVLTPEVANDFVFGDQGPVEGAWRRSSDYPFSFLIAAFLMKPAKTFGTLLDRSRIVRNLAGQLVYADTKLRINPNNIIIPSIYSSNTNIQTAGIINYIVDYVVGADLTSYNQYVYDLSNITVQLSYRLGSFSSKDQFNLILDSRSPLSSGGVFVPQENYTLILNSSSPVTQISYSGVIVTKLAAGFEVKGYSQEKPYFSYYQWIQAGVNINVGGISEVYSVWTSGVEYYVGNIVQYNNQFYRVTVTNNTSPENLNYYAKLSTLPIVGGRDANIRIGWDRTKVLNIPYGTLLGTIQDVVDFLLGYEQYLIDQGFLFNTFNNNLNTVVNWTTSAKEFMFWTTQNWSASVGKWEQWLPNIEFVSGTIIQYQGDFYRVLPNVTNSTEFNIQNFIKIDGLSTVGSSVISLSPAAAGLTFTTNNAIVDDITNSFYTYEILKVDGTPVLSNNIKISRIGNVTQYIPKINEEIYNATFYLVQKEQILLLDQTTIFNDVIYSPATGYRQERIKLSAHVGTSWDGSFNIPGFIFDQAIIKTWQEWQDYQLGDTVKYQQFYYSANSFLPGSAVFNPAAWSLLSSKPTPKLIPNWSYKASQFADFYSLDSDNLDSNQQTVAHHLIGYQKRQYLDNIIQDSVSEFKFYQGMIRDKGTQNAFSNLFNVLTNERQESLSFYEEWAARAGQYGATASFEEIEFTLDESLFKSNPQGVELLNTTVPRYGTVNTVVSTKIINRGTGYKPNQSFNVKVPTTTGHCVLNVTTDSNGKIIAVNDIVTPGLFSVIGKTGNIIGGNGTGAFIELVYGLIPSLTDYSIIKLLPDDIYLKPTGYNSNPWPLTDNSNLYLRSAGYVRLSDVKIAIGKIDTLLTNNPWDSTVEYKVNDIVVYIDQNTNEYTNYVATVGNINAIPSETSDSWSPFNMGDYIWCGFDQNDWNVYRYSSLYMKVLSITSVIVNNTAELQIDTESLVTVKVGSVIALSQTDKFLAGFYKVVSVNLSSFNVISASTPTSILEFAPSLQIIVFALTSQRISSINVADSITSRNLLPKELIWTDDNGHGTGAWGVWEYNKVYIPSVILNPLPVQYSNVGSSVAITSNSNFLVITDKTGTFYIRDKSGAESAWVLRQTIPSEVISKYADSSFVNRYTGSVLAVSTQSLENSNKWIAAGIPQASHVRTKYQGLWQRLNTYNQNDIVKDPLSNVFYQANTAILVDYPPTCIVTELTIGTVINESGAGPSVPGQQIIFQSAIGNLVPNFIYYISRILSETEFTISDTYRGDELVLSPDTNNVFVTLWQEYWNTLEYIPVDLAGTDSTLMNQGAISLYQVDKNNISTLVDTIISPNPTDGEQFGTNIVFGNDTLFVSAPGGNGGKGVVYQLVYEPVVICQRFYNPTFSGAGISPTNTSNSGTTIRVSNTIGIKVGMGIVGTGFTKGQYVAKIIDLTTFISDIAPDSEPTGLLQFTVTQWHFKDIIGFYSNQVAVGANFGYRTAISLDASTLTISSEGVRTISGIDPGRVFVYKQTTPGGTDYSQRLTITGDNIRFGEGLAVSGQGDYIAVSSPLYDGLKLSQGNVSVYKYNLGTGDEYRWYQDLVNTTPEAAQNFGSKLSFMNNFDTLVVFSRSSTNYQPIHFDGDTTTFDEKATEFSANHNGIGRVDIYDQYGANSANGNWVYSESLPNNTDNESMYGSCISVGSNSVIVGAPVGYDDNIRSGIVYEYTKPAYSQQSSSYTLTEINTEVNRVDVSKIKKVFLYNKSTEVIVSHLDIVDSLQGKILGVADEELTYKLYYDPAVYSFGDGSVPLNAGHAWSTIQVGQLWWDLRTAKFFNCYDSDVVYRNNTWNRLFPGSSIDIYEWVETTLLPSEWDAIADTVPGLAKGVSGISLYGDSAYSIVSNYNTLNESYTQKYYYWVKNNKLIPATENRTISASSVSELISNPRSTGNKFIAFTGSNSVSLFNVKPLLENSEIVLSVQYWINENSNRNIHSQWNLISSSPGTRIPGLIEQKWFDSLCGLDLQGRTVPDPTLPLKIRYGVENRPRQGMFINRFEALKQLIEQANRVLINHQVVDQFNLSKLETIDEIPNTIQGRYDIVIDTDAELSYVNTSNFKVPSLIPIIVDGRITGVKIVDPGKGYVYAPFIEVVGTGKGSVIKSIINSYGQIIGVDVIMPGEGYDSQTLLLTRSGAVLVKTDSTSFNKWAIYYYDVTTEVWSKVDTQAYDTTQFWYYIDWYQSGYNQFTTYTLVVNTFVELSTLQAEIGSLVKVITNNSGNWVLLKKYTNSTSTDWTQSYVIVGAQNGTIQFRSSLYEFDNTIYGYDNSLYDAEVYDDYASSEIRYILNAIKNDIFIDNLEQEYINLFFTSVRYILNEQLYVDWIFKTSFIKAQHNVGSLSQKVTYNNDHLSDFQSYVAEVKPYRTKIREYISNYNSLDVNYQAATDFDLPAVIKNGEMVPVSVDLIAGKIGSIDSTINTYPWKFWLDNVGFSITNLAIINGGSGYISNPIVEIVSNSGSGAQAVAYISKGTVNRIIIVKSGSGYLTAPTINLVGGLASNGTSAKAVAILGNSVIRSNLIKMKFDRITQTYFITELQETETIIGTGSKLQFPLAWAPDIRIGQSTITIDNSNVLRDTYRLKIVASKQLGYTKYSGLLVFDTAPSKGAVINISYIKDWSILNAADRIQYYYNPVTGSIGKDLSQLMTGIDYGGVTVTGLGFEINRGWDSSAYYSDRWDSSDDSFTDYIKTVSVVSNTFTLPYTPAAGTQINIYYAAAGTDKINAVRIDDPSYVGIPLVNKPSVVMATVVATGVSNTILIPDTFTITTNDTFIFRQSTSDGSISPLQDDYDTALIGGTLDNVNRVYTTATGLAADDIIVDGNGFVTTTTCPATEEVVPGQVVDTLAIKVYDRPSTSSAIILTDTYYGNGSQTEFAMSQTPNSDQAVLVKLISGYQNSTNQYTDTKLMLIDTDYTVDYRAASVIFKTAPPVGTVASITSVGFNGSNILDIKTFIANGSTNTFITTAPWITPVTSLIYIDGVQLNTSDYKLFKTTETNGLANLIGISLYEPPLADKLITYIIVSGTSQTFSIMKSEKITANGSISYPLENQVGSSLPYEGNMIVRVGQEIIKGPNVIPFIIRTVSTNKDLIYAISPDYAMPNSVNIIDVSVIVSAGILLTPITDYIVDLSGISVKLTKTIAKKYVGTDLYISIQQHPGYIYTPSNGTALPHLTFDIAYDNATIEVISFYKQDILKIGRTNVNVAFNNTLIPNTLEYFSHLQIFNRQLKLNRTILDDSYVWVIRNSTILTPSIDFKLNDDRSSITLAATPMINDDFALITFDSNILKPGISYMQFKDMLNRYQYKRLSSYKQAKLCQNLLYNDLTIAVDYAGNFSLPDPSSNRPGIIEIRGERIEYFTTTHVLDNSNDYYRLGQLRRGTLGTGTPAFHAVGSCVQEIGSSETMPYSDTTIIQQYTIPAPELLNVSITSKNGAFSCKTSSLVVGQEITINGTIGGTGSIVNYTTGKIYYIITTNGSTTFTLSEQFNGSAIKTKIGIPVGLTYTLTDISNNIIPLTFIPSATSIDRWFTDYGYTFRNEFSSTVSYTVNDVVSYNGYYYANILSYVANLSLPAITVPSQGYYWKVYSSIPVGYQQCNDIEVFVGGYDDSLTWESTVHYAIGTIVNIGSYTYKCIIEHTSSTSFKADIKHWSFFIGNIRLKKEPYSVFNVNQAPDSPAGDVRFDADFSVDGTSQEIRLTNSLAVGTRVTIIKRTLVNWDKETSVLYDTGKVGAFLKEVPGIWYTGITKYESNRRMVTLDTYTATFDGAKNTFDQG